MNKNLEIYVSGPKTSDVKIFFGDEAFSYVQSFKYVKEADQVLNIVDFSVCALRLVKIEKSEIKDDTVRIIIGNFDDVVKNHQQTDVYLGNEKIPLISKLFFNVSVAFPYNELIIDTFSSNEIFKKFPSWVGVNILRSQQQIGA